MFQELLNDIWGILELRRWNIVTCTWFACKKDNPGCTEEVGVSTVRWLEIGIDRVHHDLRDRLLLAEQSETMLGGSKSMSAWQVAGGVANRVPSTTRYHLLRENLGHLHLSISGTASKDWQQSAVFHEETSELGRSQWTVLIVVFLILYTCKGWNPNSWRPQSVFVFAKTLLRPHSLLLSLYASCFHRHVCSVYIFISTVH